MAQLSPKAVQLNAGALRRGALVFSLGSVVALVGLALATREFASAAKQYVDGLPVPPTELAKQGWAQARAVGSASATAGAEAWRKASSNR